MVTRKRKKAKRKARRKLHAAQKQLQELPLNLVVLKRNRNNLNFDILKKTKGVMIHHNSFFLILTLCLFHSTTVMVMIYSCVVSPRNTSLIITLETPAFNASKTNVLVEASPPEGLLSPFFISLS